MSTWFADQGIETCIKKEQALKKRKQFLQEAYSEKQVRKLCIKYRLRCLPVNVFKGAIDSQVPAKKRYFEGAFNQALQEQVDQTNYRIVAPSELFKVAYGDLDPLLLYRFSHHGSTYYKLVHQWGGELNKRRSLVHYPLRSVKHLTVCSLLVWLPIILTICLNLTGLSTRSTCILSGFLLTATLLCTLSFFKNRHGQYQTSDKIWDSQPVI
jgi:hypothetical protein